MSVRGEKQSDSLMDNSDDRDNGSRRDSAEGESRGESKGTEESEGDTQSHSLDIDSRTNEEGDRRRARVEIEREEGERRDGERRQGIELDREALSQQREVILNEPISPQQISFLHRKWRIFDEKYVVMYVLSLLLVVLYLSVFFLLLLLMMFSLPLPFHS